MEIIMSRCWSFGMMVLFWFQTERQIMGSVVFITEGKKQSQLISCQFLDSRRSSNLYVCLFPHNTVPSPLWVCTTHQNLSPLPLLTQRGVKVNVCNRGVIRVFLSSKTMLHRESWQIKELYLAVLTWNRSISSANSTALEKRGGSPLKQHPHSPW